MANVSKCYLDPGVRAQINAMDRDQVLAALRTAHGQPIPLQPESAYGMQQYRKALVIRLAALRNSQ